MRLFILSFLVAQSAFAQLALQPEHELPLPELTASIFTLEPSSEPAVQLTDAEVAALAAELTRQFEKYARMTKPQSCSAEFALALQVRGDYDSCVAYARECRGETTLRGALCAAANYDYATADELFATATPTPEATLQWASYSLFGIHEAEVTKVLSRQSGWNLEERKLWEGVLRRLGQIQLEGVTKEQVDSFLLAQINANTGSFQALLKQIRLSILQGEYNYDAAIKTLQEYAPTLGNPLLWYSLAYHLLYYGLDTDFAKSRLIYDAYDPYAHKWSAFPTENNTYNYTQIYSSVCRDTLAQDSAALELRGIKKDIQNGRIDAATALSRLADLNVRVPNKADVLTTIGGVYSMLERHEEAVESYWQAHRLCRYYNRANWGLALERRFNRYRAMPDYLANLDRLTRETAALKVPTKMGEYLINWGSLAAEAQKRVLYGARIWLPFVDGMVGDGGAAYIKYAHELISESPGMEMMRDQRSTRKNDRRLWDDIRGAGGNPVIADLSEVMQTVNGDYNLLGHEMAHQFHSWLGSAHWEGYRCIDALFAKAGREDNFPDAYSRTNVQEYFAQLVTYYLVPEDSPKRFGLNRRWLIDNDAPAFDFVLEIDTAAGDLSQIACPLN